MPNGRLSGSTPPFDSLAFGEEHWMLRSLETGYGIGWPQESDQFLLLEAKVCVSCVLCIIASDSFAYFGGGESTFAS